ncbi:MAG: DUF3426 domain-containing protein [Thermodesulfobacteriota bacterium]
MMSRNACPKCGVQLMETDRFCPQCGRRLTPGGSGRLVLLIILLLLAAGVAVAGYTGALDKLSTGREAKNELPVRPEAKETAGRSPDLLTPEAAQYQEIESGDGRRMLLVTGRVRNNNPEPRRLVRVKCTILDQEGRVLAEQTVLCGRILTQEELKDLSPGQITSRLIAPEEAGPAQTPLPPGQTLEFMFAFLPSPPDKAVYTVEVQDSQPVTGQP